MKLIRKLLRRTPFYGLYKSAGHYPDYWYWKLRGEPSRSPHLVKQRAVGEYAERFGLRVLIETGTYYGEMVSAMKNRFLEIYSIEYDHALALGAQRKFSSWRHIHVLEGDSQLKIPELLTTLNKPALFWLDAGYYGWAGLQGNTQRLAVELDSILRHRVPGHVILMDDAHGLNGENGSPTLDEVRRHIQLEFPGRVVEVRHDILRITPSGN